ncbi:hypothetical protein [Rhizosphaericola mali]|uniref:Late embryogenesis abundant protein LEA-2 subgroup domain-containing protein n=1 Tax=Rhizosphaericola mali TaxID=2545455 RepID=A0A5P2G0N8_9BACT|nr:hypothetical protein [Rhizosphaericola mali]QES87402.1 hypothetical protein E0W69_001570 [Rhizosphaericola mali]
MKRGKIWGISGLFSAISICIFSSCSQPKALVFKEVKGVKLEEVGQDSSTLWMDVVYANPNKFDMQFKKVDCHILVENDTAGHYVQDTMVNIPALQDFEYATKVRLSMKPIYNNALRSFFSKSIHLKVVGKVKVGRHGVYINMPIDFTKEQKINF